MDLFQLLVYKKLKLSNLGITIIQKEVPINKK